MKNILSLRIGNKDIIIAYANEQDSISKIKELSCEFNMKLAGQDLRDIINTKLQLSEEHDAKTQDMLMMQLADFEAQSAANYQKMMQICDSVTINDLLDCTNLSIVDAYM